MYTIFAGVGILVVMLIAEVYFNRPWLEQLRSSVERMCSKSYGAMFGWPVVYTGAAFAISALVGLVSGLGVINAMVDTGTACMFIFLGGIVGCFFSFLGDVGSLGKSAMTGKPRSAKPDVRVSSSVFFFMGLYGSIVMIVLKMSGFITEPVISITVGG